MRNRLQATSVAEAVVEAPVENESLYRVLQIYLEDLTKAETPESVFGALHAFAAYFCMPHMQILESRLGGASRRLQSISISPDAPQAVLNALHSHPLFDWALDARTPVFLSEADGKLAARGIKRPPELVGVEGLMANFEIETGYSRYYIFLGAGATANGASRTLLHAAALSAHEYLMAPRPRAVAAQIAPTAREREVLDLAMAGFSDNGIARALGLATRTVRFHLRNAKRKFRASTRGELIAHAVRQRGADQCD
jgi:DNA-binding CsgD family transcriptional regulator